MEKLVKLDIIEHYWPDEDEPLNETLIVKTNNIENITDRIQKSFEEYLKSLGYESNKEQNIIENAMDDSIRFGNTYQDIPESLQKKYNYKIINLSDFFDAEIEADFDYGFKKPN